MRIDQPEAATIQAASLDHVPDFAGVRQHDVGQLIEQRKRPSPLPQRAQRKFAYNEGMRGNLATLKLVAHLRVSRPEVVDPHGGVGEDHLRRRGIFPSCGMVPPSAANRRALSLSIRALSASRSNAAFSSTPVNSWAVRTSSSSSATVVRMALIVASGDDYFRAWTLPHVVREWPHRRIWATSPGPSAGSEEFVEGHSFQLCR